MANTDFTTCTGSLPSLEYSTKDRTVTVTHRPWNIAEYAEVRAGQVAALLAVLSRQYSDSDKEIVFGLAEQLAGETSSLISMFAPEIEHG